MLSNMLNKKKKVLRVIVLTLDGDEFTGNKLSKDFVFNEKDILKVADKAKGIAFTLMNNEI